MSFEEIFQPWSADLYDQTETETRDVALLEKLIDGSGKLTIFEVACGSGRILLPLVRGGHRVTGMDRDSMMLSKLFKKAEGMQGFTVMQADAVEADWGSGYDLVVLAGNILLNIVSAMNLLEAGQLFIRKAYAALKPGGRLFMDNNGFLHLESAFAFNHPGERIIFDGTDSAGVYGKYMLIDSSYDDKTQCVSGIRRWELTTPLGEVYRKEEPYSKAVPSIPQMEEWLKAAGFLLEKRFGDFECNPVDDNTHREIYLAKKP